MITKVNIGNYRSCVHTTFACHPNLSVLIGPNGSGKTNVFQALMLLNRIAIHPLVDRERSPNVAPMLSITFGTGKQTLNLRARLWACTDESNTDTPVFLEEQWRITDAGGRDIVVDTPLLQWWRASQKRRPWGYPVRLMRKRWAPRHQQQERFWPEDVNIQDKRLLSDIGRISAFLDGMRYYSASQFTNPGRCPMSIDVDQEGRLSRPWAMSAHGRLLFDIYARSKESPVPYQRFLDIVGRNGLHLVDHIEFRAIGVATTQVTAGVGGQVNRESKKSWVIIPRFRKGRGVLSPNQLSEGTFRTLALLFYVITGESTALFIEEPEVCVHHGLLSSILELVKKYSRGKQVFLSTHSDFVLDSVAPENVLIVRNDPRRGTLVRPVRKGMTAREYKALHYYLEHEGTLGEYWRAGGLDGVQP